MAFTRQPLHQLGQRDALQLALRRLTGGTDDRDLDARQHVDGCRLDAAAHRYEFKNDFA